MKPLVILLVAFVVSLAATKIFFNGYEFALSGRIAMSVMLTFTAIAHFAFTKGMSMMLPAFIPYKTMMVYITGVIEIVAAIGLFIPNFRLLTAWLLIIFFVLILPANVYAAVKNIDYQKGTFGGNGVSYLWFRIPLQLLFIVWTYISVIKT